MKKKFHLFVLFLCISSIYTYAAVVYSAPLQAKELGMGNLLNWKTSLEEDLQYFIIEKSVDGINFENIGTVEANSEMMEEASYRFFDTKLGAQKSYYRLKVMEADSRTSYSQTVLVEKEKPNNFAIVAFSSVIAKDNFNLTLDSVTEGQLEYALVSYKGEMVFEEFKYIYPGLNELSLSLQDLPSGIYKVKLKLEAEEEFLVIQKAGEDKANVASTTKIKKKD